MKHLAIFLAIVTLPTFFARAAEKPNIVFVLFDDLGYGQPGCYRTDSQLKTPNLDRLAAQGMRFTDAHAAAAVGTPTRCGLRTGRYPSRIGPYGVLTTYSYRADEKTDRRGPQHTRPVAGQRSAVQAGQVPKACPLTAGQP
jgi:hypothetical protein